MTLKGKMTLWYTVLMVVIVAAVLGFMLYTSESVMEKTAENTLETAVEQNMGEVWYEHGIPMVYGFRGYENGVYMAVYDAHGTRLAGWELLKTDLAPFEEGKFTVLEWEESFFYCYDRFVPAGNRASGEMMACGEMCEGVWIRGILPAEGLEDVVSSLVKLAFVALPLLLVLAVAGGWFIAHRSLKPVRTITEIAREVSAGQDLSRRIELGKGQDEIHTLADTFNQMFSRLERSFLAERQFASDASHELRTPTAIILAECSAAEVAMEREDLDGICESLMVIERQSRKMSALISRLLAYTRLTQKDKSMEKENVNLSELVLAVCQEQERICQRAIRFETAIEPDVQVWGNIDVLMGIVQNLVSNACKYGREGGYVRIGLRRTEALVRLSVEDDGIGISETDVVRIWDRFFQADPARSNADGSLGLGLSMAQEGARLHGGEITVESVLGKGSCFVFAMPGEI